MEKFLDIINLFDFFFLIIILYCVIQCFFKGFTLSLISFMKWVLSTIITIILVPKFQPVVRDFKQSEFINSIGLGFTIFVFTLFLTILIGKTLSRAITWTGVGSIDKGFGFLFGFLVILFQSVYFQFLIVLSLSKLGYISREGIFFYLINKGSVLLIEEFPLVKI